MFFEIFLEKRAVRRLRRGFKQNEERFFTLQQDLMVTVYLFHSANSLTLKFEHCGNIRGRNLNAKCLILIVHRDKFIGDNKIYYKSDIRNR